MSGYEVPQPVLNSPFDPPARYWHIVEGQPPVQVEGRRKAVYFYRDPRAKDAQGQGAGVPVELPLVNLIRQRVDDWRSKGYPGVTRTTLELLQWWNRDGRERRLFFA
jgi:type III restriction enzyme